MGKKRHAENQIPSLRMGTVTKNMLAMEDVRWINVKGCVCSAFRRHGYHGYHDDWLAPKRPALGHAVPVLEEGSLRPAQGTMYALH